MAGNATAELKLLAGRLRKQGHASSADFALTSYESELEAGVRESVAAHKWISTLRNIKESAR
jgi:hypothetical protein